MSDYEIEKRLIKIDIDLFCIKAMIAFAIVMILLK